MSKRVIHISESEAAASDLATLLARVRAGQEFIIGKDKKSVAVCILRNHCATRYQECIAMLSEDSSATIDSDFPKDVEEGVASHREPLDSPAWD